MELDQNLILIGIIIISVLILTVLARNRILGSRVQSYKKITSFSVAITTNALITYKPFSKYEKTLETIAESFLDHGTKVLVVSTASRTQRYMTHFKEPFSKGDVDLVKITASPRNDRSILKREAGKVSEVSVDWLEYLSEVIETLPQKSAVFFEPLSDLILINGFEKTFKFLKKTIDYSTHERIKVISFLNNEAHDEAVKASFEGLFSKIADISEEGFRIIK